MMQQKTLRVRLARRSMLRAFLRGLPLAAVLLLATAAPAVAQSSAQLDDVCKVTLDRQGSFVGTASYWYRYNKSKPYFFYQDQRCTKPLGGTGYHIALPRRSNQTFGGYFTGKNGTGKQYIKADGACTNQLWKVRGNTTLYAKWTSGVVGAIYKVVLRQSGGVEGTTSYWYRFNTSTPYFFYENSRCTIPLGGTGKTIKLPRHVGHVFKGYFTGKNGTGTQYVRADGTCINQYWKVPFGGTLYAYWVRAS